MLESTVTLTLIRKDEELVGFGDVPRLRGNFDVYVLL